MIYRAYKVELDPNDKQRTALLRHAGAARFAYNWGLDQWKRMYEAGEKPDHMKLNKVLNALKAKEFPWMYQVSKCAMQGALIDLGKAYKRFFTKKGGYPKYKSRRRSKLSFMLMSPLPMKVTSKTIKLPVIGTLRLKERDHIPTDVAIKQVTVCERAGKWFVVAVIKREDSAVEATGKIIGVDLGLKTLATCSDGSTYENAKYLKKSTNKIKGLSRKLARQKKGSNRREKTKAKLAKVHARVANQRSDAIHKMTTDIVRTKRPEVIVIEDLNVKNMVKNHKLAGAISDAAFGEIRRQLEYKAKWYGSKLVIADCFFPSTKMCSCCGTVKEMELNDRVYECAACGNVMDRDLNAALNLAKIPTVSSTGYARGGSVRPQDIVAAPVKREPDRRLVIS